jgi:hypothetical protein
MSARDRAAVAPLEAYAMPLLSTIVATAVPPETTYSNPPLLTTVALALP